MSYIHWLLFMQIILKAFYFQSRMERMMPSRIFMCEYFRYYYGAYARFLSSFLQSSKYFVFLSARHPYVFMCFHHDYKQKPLACLALSCCVILSHLNSFFSSNMFDQMGIGENGIQITYSLFEFEPTSNRFGDTNI